MFTFGKDGRKELGREEVGGEEGRRGGRCEERGGGERRRGGRKLRLRRGREGGRLLRPVLIRECRRERERERWEQKSGRCT